MYQQTKGVRGYLLNELGTWVYNKFGELSNLTELATPYSGHTLGTGEMYALANLMAVIQKIVRVDQDFHIERFVDRSYYLNLTN